MNCSKCGAASKVYNTAKTKTHVYRERICDKCGNKWFTVESEADASVGSLINNVKESRRYERRRGA